MTIRSAENGCNKYCDFVPEETEGNPFKWITLESWLEAFTEMIEQKRIVAQHPDAPYPHRVDGEVAPDQRRPWCLGRDDEKLVEITIKAWDGLLSAIRSRLPDVASLGEPGRSLYNTQAIELCDIRGLFLKKFLQRATLPNFKFIAPGLRISSEAELSVQPFSNSDVSDFRPHPNVPFYIGSKTRYYPFLFLRADKSIRSVGPSNAGLQGLKPEEHRLNGFPWQLAWEFETGLYLLPSKHMERPDGCRLLLPFPMTPTKWIKFGSGDLLEPMACFDGLYQPQAPHRTHYAIVAESQDEVEWCLRLELLLNNWTSMIEDGHWEVGAEGVLGGIEKFKEADSEEQCELYFIPKTW
jgi:hypothetical protein